MKGLECARDRGKGRRMLRYVTVMTVLLMSGWAAATIWDLKGGSRRRAFFLGFFLGFAGLAFVILGRPSSPSTPSRPVEAA
jgi:hypothetical protein